MRQLLLALIAIVVLVLLNWGIRQMGYVLPDLWFIALCVSMSFLVIFIDQRMRPGR
jgi:hypothetical protein